MRFLLVLVVIFSCSVLVSTSHAATVASPGEDASAVKEELATSGSFVKGQRSLEKRTLCGTDSDCQLVASLLPILYPNGARCEKWLCVPKCGDLMDWDIFSHKCRDVSSDTDNCGKCGQKCTLPGATQTTCEHGQCRATCCEAGYTLGDGVCSLNPSQHARAKRSSSTPARKKLCPGVHEQACPIFGSSTYVDAVKHLFAANEELSGVMSGVGGFECIDTTQALDSCGGCASTGEGMDCTKIRGAHSVGCESSRCVVLSCDAGWRPSPRGDKCVRARSAFLPARNATAHASHKHLGAGMRHAS
ncbi:hypothetical protein JCM8208_003972 [Rhodotorula glutinis]